MKIIFKYKTYLLLMLLFSSSSFTNFGQPKHGVDPCNMSNNSFKGGEHIVYKIYYNLGFLWLSAGEVDFKLTEDDNSYTIEATGRTYASYEIFFKVNDYYKTVIDKETLLPIEFERKVEEGGYRFYNRIEFDQNNGTAVSFSGKTEESVSAQEYPLEKCMHDMISTIYFLRNLNFKSMQNNDEFPVDVFIDNEVFPINIAYKGQDVKKIKGFGKINAFRMCPEVVAGVVFSNDATMDIWVSDDENKIPLIIESPISVGSIQAILISHTGLKHPLGVIN